MIVVVSKIREDLTGVIEAYEVDQDEFYALLNQLNPVSEEDWHEVVWWLEEHGRLIDKFTPDYTISINI